MEYNKNAVGKVKVLLRPFSWLYGEITRFRNKGFDTGRYASVQPDIFSVSVGNLTVGGTGKTPMIEYLIRNLLPTYSIATLSRGYGRATRGFRIATEYSTAAEIGDEPLQYYTKFGQFVKVAVCEKRVEGSRKLHELYPEIDVLLLDDAYQHRAIQPHVSLLLSDYNRPFYEDRPFPEGFLREQRGGAVRADAVVVTKCPLGLEDSERRHIADRIRQYARPEVPVFFASVRYGEVQPYDQVVVPSFEKVVAAAGIAQPAPFFEHVGKRFEIVDQLRFRDHHNFTEADLDTILKCAKSGTFVATTEKDMVKLKPLTDQKGVSDRFVYWPIEMDFGKDTNRMREWIETSIRKPLLRF